MAQYIFKLPDLGEGTAEAELVGWHVKLGDIVTEDQPLADVMTDKATVEVTSPVAGRVVALHCEVGVAAAVGSPLIEFETEASDDHAGKAEDSAAPVAAPVTSPVTSRAHDGGSSRPKASPALRRRALEAGIRLEDVNGSGPNGRIRQSDIEAYLADRESRRSASDASILAATPVADAFRDVKLVGLRRKIAEKMELSTRRIPHFSYIEEVDVTELERVRGMLNAHYDASRPALTFLPFFIVALARIVPRFPQINATFDEENGVTRQFTAIHVGIATQTDQGLMVPVLRDAQALGLWDLARELRRLASATRDGTARREELSGSTITITSLGTLGGVATTPVINHPEVAILGPNRIVERPMVRDGGVEVRKMMNISSSFDHRVIDGRDAAKFIQELKALIEQPTVLLAD